jgi:hypothetical protein
VLTDEQPGRFLRFDNSQQPSQAQVTAQQLSLTYSKPTNDSQSPSAGEDLGVVQVTGVRLNKPTKRPTRAKAPR